MHEVCPRVSIPGDQLWRQRDVQRLREVEPRRREVHPYAGGEPARGRLWHLHQGLPVEQAQYRVPPDCRLDDETRSPCPAVRCLGGRPDGVREAEAEVAMVDGPGESEWRASGTEIA